MRYPKRSVFLAFIAVAAMAATLATAATQRVEISLSGALQQPNGGDPKPLYLSTTLEDGKLGWLLGDAPDYNRSLHRGRVLGGSLESGRLEVEVEVPGDPWIPGGRAHFTLSLKPDGENRWKGTYDGAFGAFTDQYLVTPTKGEATVEVTAPLKPAAGYNPPSRNEHPRMIIRRSELDALREKAQTPLGKALVARIKSHQKDPIALGMMYLLTGDESYAHKARPILQRMMDDESPGAFNGSDGAYARRVGHVTIACDMMWQAYPEDFQRRMVEYFARRADRMLFRPNTITEKVNWSPNSNYSGHLNGASALAGLIIYDKPGREPMKPRDPGNEPRVVSPPAAFSPHDSVPVNSLAIGTMPSNWLHCGPLPNSDDLPVDLFENGGGSAQANPKAGDGLTFGGKSCTFTPLPEAGIWKRKQDDPAGFCIEMMGATKKSYNSLNYFYTIVRVDKAITVQFRDGGSGGNSAEFWLSGEILDDRDFITLQPGLHPLLARVQFHKINPWGKSWIRPAFNSVTDEQIKEGLELAQAKYRLRLAKYHEDLAYWQNNDRASAYYNWLSQCGTTKATWYHRYCFGNGGFQVEGESYTGVGCNEPLLFEVCHRNQFGHPSTGRPDVTHFGPRYIAQTIYGPEGIHAHQSFSLTDGSQKAGRWAITYPLTPDQWKPAALWAWNKAMGLPKGGAGKSAVQRADDAAFIQHVASHCGDPVYTLLHYPMDVVPRNPDGIIPRVWEAETKGLYVFRNGWEGTEDIVTQLFLKSEGEGGWRNNDAGSLRLWGLGQLWTHRGTAPGKTRLRWYETVVCLPDDDNLDGMRATKSDFRPREDGSGSITANMDLVYAGQRTWYNEKGKLQQGPLVNNRFELQRQNIVSIGITGQRALGVDYSGRCGAPALLVLVDQIDGGGRKVWNWQVPEGFDKGDVTFSDDGFTMAKGGASLKATFISPRKINIGFTNQEVTFKPAGDRYKTKVTVALRAIQASSVPDDTDGHFMVVLTLQRGKAAPRVTSLGKGLNARVIVGGVPVRFEGNRVIIGK